MFYTGHLILQYVDTLKIEHIIIKDKSYYGCLCKILDLIANYEIDKNINLINSYIEE